MIESVLSSRARVWVGCWKSGVCCLAVLTGLAGLAPAMAAAQAGTGAIAAAVNAPRAVGTIESKALDGEPVMLAWSPDQSQLYVQSMEKTRLGWAKSFRHFIVTVASGNVARVDVQPPWAEAYWGWKSSRRSPAAPEFMLSVGTQLESRHSVNTPTGGALARGGTSATNEDANWVANQQTVNVAVLKVGGETIGEWLNEPVTPGTNYTWAPAPYHLLAYARRSGGPLILLDDQGGREELAVAKAAVLPAWSNSGHELAWLERRSKSQFDVMVATVTTR
jgi:hypothetical protein